MKDCSIDLFLVSQYSLVCEQFGSPCSLHIWKDCNITLNYRELLRSYKLSVELMWGLFIIVNYYDDNVL